MFHRKKQKNRKTNTALPLVVLQEEQVCSLAALPGRWSAWCCWLSWHFCRNQGVSSRGNQRWWVVVREVAEWQIPLSRSSRVHLGTSALHVPSGRGAQLHRAVWIHTRPV